MADLIDRAALEKHLAELAHFNRLPRDTKELSVVDVEDLIDHQRTVDAAPVVHAYWKGPFAGRAICSSCNEDQDIEMFVGNPTQKWCARCGAKMDADAPERAGKDRRE